MGFKLRACSTNNSGLRAVVVVAQFVERLHPTQEIRSSNPVVGKILSTNCTIKNRKDENKENKEKACPFFSKKTSGLGGVGGGGSVSKVQWLAYFLLDPAALFEQTGN